MSLQAVATMMVLACQSMDTATVTSVRALVVADEIPAMQVLADAMRILEGVETMIVRQDAMPSDFGGYGAVLVYIHGALQEAAEVSLLSYAQAGGRLILLHHSISSGKRRNLEWFPRLGIELPEGDVAAGGYRWIEGVRLQLANLAPRHFITTHRVSYPETVPYPDSRGRARLRPGFTLAHSEVYINHRLSGKRTTLLGFRYTDAPSGVTWTQPTAGWIMRMGKGHVVYLMPGHTVEEFRDPVYSRIVTNAVIWKP